MATPVGIKSLVQFGREATWATAATVNRRVNFLSQSIEAIVGMADDLQMQGPGVWHGSEITPIGEKAEGDLTMYLDYEGLLQFYDCAYGSGAYGSYGALVSGSNPYTHVFYEQEMLNSLTMELAEAGIAPGTVQQILGAKVNKWSVQCQAAMGEQGLARATFGITGQKKVIGVSPTASVSLANGTTNASTTVTRASGSFVTDMGLPAGYTGGVPAGQYPITGTDMPAGAYIVSVTSATSIVISAVATGSTAGTAALKTGFLPLTVARLPVIMQHCTIMTDGSGDTGADIPKVKDFSIAVTPAIATDRMYLGSQYIDEPYRAGLVKATMKFKREYRTNAFITAYKAGTVITSQVKFTNGVQSVQFDLQRGKVIAAKVGITAPGIIEQEVEVQATWYTGGTPNNGLKTTFINTQSGASI